MPASECRIVAPNLWQTDHLDLVEEAAWVVRAAGQRKIAIWERQASLDIGYGPDKIGFIWVGIEELEKNPGIGSAELQANESLKIAFAYQNSDRAVLTAVRDPSSTHTQCRAGGFSVTGRGHCRSGLELEILP